MSTELENRIRILETAGQHFFQFGFSRVTVSDIATDLGMSKKTLYEYFPSKEDLLSAIIESMQAEITTKIETLASDQGLEFDEKLRKIMEIVALFYSKFTSHFLVDLQKSAPHIWKSCDEFRRQNMRAQVAKLVREGTQKGVFRNDIHEDVLVLIHVGAIAALLHPEVLPHLPLSTAQAFETVVKVLLEGILTDQAREKYSKPGRKEFAG